MDKKDIWVEGIKNIMGYVKRSLLDYVDACDKRVNDPKVTEVLGKIKGRIHNDVSQGEFMIGILFTTMKAGGDIAPFQEDFRIPNKQKNSAEKFFKSGSNSGNGGTFNPVFKKDESH